MIRGMAMARREKPTEKQLQGFTYFRKLLLLFERLHAVGTARNRAGTSACNTCPTDCPALSSRSASCNFDDLLRTVTNSFLA